MTQRTDEGSIAASSAEAPDHAPEKSHAGHVHGPDCDHDHHDHGSQQPFLRDGPKVGRNDPCPCGSGKKHKKCCGRAT
jgi:uncharacterized protein YecA (UPF0149 family)